MTNYIFQQPNLTTGLDDAVIDVATAVPSFPIMILIFTFFTTLFGGMAAQNKRVGFADMPMWTMLASLATLLLSLLFTIKEGIISGWVLGIVVAVNILCGFWYFMSKGKGEM